MFPVFVSIRQSTAIAEADLLAHLLVLWGVVADRFHEQHPEIRSEALLGCDGSKPLPEDRRLRSFPSHPSWKVGRKADIRLVRVSTPANSRFDLVYAVAVLREEETDSLDPTLVNCVTDWASTALADPSLTEKDVDLVDNGLRPSVGVRVSVYGQLSDLPTRSGGTRLRPFVRATASAPFARSHQPAACAAASGPPNLFVPASCPLRAPSSPPRTRGAPTGPT